MQTVTGLLTTIANESRLCGKGSSRSLIFRSSLTLHNLCSVGIVECFTVTDGETEAPRGEVHLASKWKRQI